MLSAEKIRDVETSIIALEKNDLIENAQVKNIELGSGSAFIEITAPQELYDKVLSEICGTEIEDQADLLKIVRDYSHAKREYDKVAQALEEVKENGYGIMPPLLEEISLEEPEIIRQGGRFGVRLQASAPS